jgi:hypothetical protein
MSSALRIAAMKMRTVCFLEQAQAVKYDLNFASLAQSYSDDYDFSA